MASYLTREDEQNFLGQGKDDSPIAVTAENIPAYQPRQRPHSPPARGPPATSFLSSQQAAAITAWVQSAAKQVSQTLDDHMGSHAGPARRPGPGANKGRTGKFIRKFGPIILIITLLFAVKYLLLSIHLNLRSMHSSVIEHCNNTRILESDETSDRYGHMEGVKNEAWRQHRMVGRGAYGFVQWSAYRVHDSMVVAVGMGSALLRDHRRVSSCGWHSATGDTIAGDPSVAYPLEKASNEYETIILRCTLRGKVPSEAGGYLSARIDGEHVILHREERDSATHRLLSDAHAHLCTFCTFPLHSPVDGARLRDWLDIHRAAGAEHVVGYDAGGVGRDAVAAVKPFVAEGFLELLPMKDVTHFDIAEHGKLMAMHDCLFRSALTSAWALFIDWDDLLGLYKPLSLPDLLHEHAGRPWLSFGCQVWSTKKCLQRRDPGVLPQERMVFHWPHFLCTEGQGPPVDARFCPGGRGHRYLIVNTQKVSLLLPHEVREPHEGGLDLSVEDVRHERFESLHLAGASEQWCSELHGEGDIVEWWAKGFEIKKRLEGVRKKALALGKP